MTKSLSLGEIEQTVFELTRELMSYDEPIPAFGTRFPHVLESCLAVPFQRFSRRSLYQTLPQKAAILFYLLIKNHPFRNGNKRIAIASLMYFLYKNRKWIRVDQMEFYNFALWVAESPAILKKQTIAAVEEFIKRYLVDRE